MDTVIINVNGRKFELSTDSFEKFPETFASRLAGMECGYKGNKRLYFIERHSEIFQYVLFYYQFGELHMPRSVCPTLFKKELDFWGVDVSSLENCCLDVYGMAYENLRRLDDFEKDYEVKADEQRLQRFPSKWSRFQKTMWQILDNPFASKWSEVFYWSSIMFVFLSIFALTAATHPLFKVEDKLDKEAVLSGHFGWTISEGSIPTDDDKEIVGFFSHTDDSIMTFSGSINNSLGSGNGSEDVTTYFGSSATVLRKKDEIALLEFICFIFFTVEVVAKLLFCPRFRVFFSSVLNIVDLLAIFPRYILLTLDYFVVSRDVVWKMEEVFEGIAVLRVFRLLRLARRVRGLRVLIYAIKAGLKDVLLMGLMLFMATIIFASLMYYVDTRKQFPSIPHGLWWAIVTLTTVGYGDMVPQTAPGKLLGSFCAITGLLIVAITVPIFVSKFLLYYNHVARKNQVSVTRCNKRYPVGI